MNFDHTQTFTNTDSSDWTGSVNIEAITTDMLPCQFDRYELISLLGEGGMARVFKANLLGPAGFKKLVALKFIKPQAEGISQEEIVQLAKEACHGVYTQRI